MNWWKLKSFYIKSEWDWSVKEIFKQNVGKSSQGCEKVAQEVVREGRGSMPENK